MCELLELLTTRNAGTTAERSRAVESVLNRSGQQARDQIADWVGLLLPVETLVPEIYREWRPVVRDALRFFFSQLSAARLAPKLVDQADLAPDTTTETRLGRLITRMPGLQKLGQVLARNRHLDASLRSELVLLENGMCDVGFAEIQRIIAAELGSRMETYAVELDPALLAEASVSAVVRFTWRDPASGHRERGVLKVLKPHVEECLAEDLHLFQQIADRFAAHTLRETLNEVCDLLAREVNFRQEQDTLQRAANAYRGIPGVRVPRLILRFCTSQITAMTEEQGVKITDAFAGNVARRAEIAEQLVAAVIAAPLLAGGDELLFHADPHAGNLLYNEQTHELVLLDWALSERLTREHVRQVCLMAVMLALRDTGGAMRAIAALGDGDIGIVREHVHRFLAELPFWRLPGSVDAMRLLDRLALAGIRFPAPLLILRKVLFTLDGILHQLAGPGLSLDAVLLRYVVTHGRLPLAASDWITLQCSAMFCGSRLWLQAISAMPLAGMQ